jgi:hypothetical protein
MEGAAAGAASRGVGAGVRRAGCGQMVRRGPGAGRAAARRRALGRRSPGLAIRSISGADGIRQGGGGAGAGRNGPSPGRSSMSGSLLASETTGA